MQFIYFIFDIHILGFSLDGRLGCAYLSGFLLKTLSLAFFASLAAFTLDALLVAMIMLKNYMN